MMAEDKRRQLKVVTAPAGTPGPEAPLIDESDPLARQRRYVAEQKRKGGGLGLVFADAFIRGMREIGYKNPAWAIAEMIDNSFQAGATIVDIRMDGVDWKAERSKPDQIAVIDNGIGMIDEMIRHAVRWGGTDRENNRQGFGRYGYGLPSAAVSLARRYSVYSKTAGDKWHVVNVDLEALSEVASDVGKIDGLLDPKTAELPAWLKATGGAVDVETLESGTIVVLEDLDRLYTMTGWITAKSLQIKLLQQFGLIYRHTLPNKKIHVAGAKTDVIDPLFLLPGARYKDETSVKAKSVRAAAFEVEGTMGKGVVKIRAALLPPNFQNADPTEFGSGAKGRRFDIMRSNNGIIVCRAGRQIDVVSPEWTKFQNYDLNTKIEIDFDPVLDEFFGLTTSKQQIVIDDQMWEKLKQTGKSSGGLQDLIKSMRKEDRRLRAELRAQESGRDGGKPRPSAAAMQAAEKFKTRPSGVSPQKKAAADKALNEYAQDIANDKKLPIEEAAASAKRETDERHYEVEFAAREEAPMYQVRRLGLQKRLTINTSHPFFEKIYQQAGEAKAGLEVFLFVLADAELDADGDREAFYRAERIGWSEDLNHALEQLVSDEAVTDRASAEAESG
jgi:hypothetical protein